MCKAFTVWCFLAICVFGRSSSMDSSSNVCVPFPEKMGLQKLCGYNGTSSYDYLSHFDSAVRAVKTVSRLIGSCSAYANLIICSVYIPRCVSNIGGPYLPCRRVCDEFNDKCGDKIQKHGLEWIIGMCQLLPQQDDPQTNLGYLGRCFEPPNFKTNFTVESVPKPIKCYPLVVAICQNIGYEYTVLNTEKQKAYIGYANRKLSILPKDNSTVDCPLDRKRFFCTENFPACINKTIAFYCRQKCEEFFHRNCSSPFFYDKNMCMEFPMGSSPVDICKQTHWPRSQNWPAVKRQTRMRYTTSTAKPTTTNSVLNTNSPSGNKDQPTDSVLDTNSPSGNKNNKDQPTDSVINTNSPSGNKDQPTDSVLDSNGPSGNKDQPKDPKAKARQDKKTSKNQAPKIAGGVLAAAFIIALILVIAYIIYRKKRRITIPYDKQILYNDETVDF